MRRGLAKVLPDEEDDDDEGAAANVRTGNSKPKIAAPRDSSTTGLGILRTEDFIPFHLLARLDVSTSSLTEAS
jgi:hypothetical protein